MAMGRWIGGTQYLRALLFAVAAAMPFGAPAQAQTLESIRYAGGARHTLDVYRPDRRGAPVIVFIYGGSWQNGDKATYSFLGRSLAQRGYLTVIPNYRVYPEVRYPSFLEDAAKAVRWARANAARFGGDANNIYLAGHSAGAYNAAMLAYDPRWLRAVGLSPNQIAGFIGLAGPYDFLPLRDETLATIFGGANRRDTQPITYASRRVPPSLLLVGGLDTTVEPGNSSRLAKALRAAGNQVTLRRYAAVGHIAILGGFGTPLEVVAPVRGDIDTIVAATRR